MFRSTSAGFSCAFVFVLAGYLLSLTVMCCLVSVFFGIVMSESIENMLRYTRAFFLLSLRSSVKCVYLDSGHQILCFMKE